MLAVRSAVSGCVQFETDLVKPPSKMYDDATEHMLRDPILEPFGQSLLQLICWPRVQPVFGQAEGYGRVGDRVAKRSGQWARQPVLAVFHDRQRIQVFRGSADHPEQEKAAATYDDDFEREPSIGQKRPKEGESLP
jgi:hypothetical protein